MAQKISRRKLAQYTADQIQANVPAPLEQLAAYLVESGRTNEAELVVRDIETALLSRGIAVVRVTVARPLQSAATAEIEAFVKAHYPGVTKVTIEEILDESIIGGMKLSLPDAQLDASIKTKLEKLMV